MARGFYSDLPKDRLLAMREKGMSNKEIAMELHVSYDTVLKLIGKQPPQNRQSPVVRQSPTVNNSIEACLAVTYPEIRLSGKERAYIIHKDQEEFEIVNADDVLIMTCKYTELDDFIKELQAIQRNMNKIRNMNRLEMW